MANSPAAWLRELEKIKGEFDGRRSARKLTLLQSLQRRRLNRASQVFRLHEVLSFLRAYPDDATLLRQVETMLNGFEGRGDLRLHRDALQSTGIVGTTMHFAFYAETASWLANHWGASLTIDWEAFENQTELEKILSQLVLYGEAPGLDVLELGPTEWIELFKAPHETDAAFLMKRLAQLPMDPIAWQSLVETLEIPFQLSPTATTPARTREKSAGDRIVYPSGPLRRSRSVVFQEMERPPESTQLLSSRRGKTVLDLARSTMVNRARDLDAFCYGDPRDVRLVDCGEGLTLAFIGVTPERRELLATLYGFMMLRNGVPVGYGSLTCLFDSAEVAFTVFDTYRSGEAAWLFARVLATARHLFGCEAFSIDPCQLDNDDAIASGAWWFYQKLGFRPRSRRLLQLMRREITRMKTNRRHRSSRTTLEELTTESLCLIPRERGDEVMGVLPLENVSLALMDYLARRFGHDRRGSEDVCALEAARKLGVRSQGKTKGERLAFRRWAPLILILPTLARWPAKDRRALATLVYAKGSQRESEFLRRFDGHARLRRAIVRLSR